MAPRASSATLRTFGHPQETTSRKTFATLAAFAAAFSITGVEQAQMKISISIGQNSH